MATGDKQVGLTRAQAFQKRLFDIAFSTLGLLLTGWVIFLAFIAASIDTRSNGFFLQKRVGREGKLFSIVKIKTMRPHSGTATNVTTSADPRITTLGRQFRRYKIDELPQFWNVLIGDMSFVGPRPDVPGFADRLKGEERLVLSVRPGITGPATLKYRNEEELLAAQGDPEAYNRDVIYPDKIRINLTYIHHWRLVNDLKCIWETISG